MSPYWSQMHPTWPKLFLIIIKTLREFPFCDSFFPIPDEYFFLQWHQEQVMTSNHHMHDTRDSIAHLVRSITLVHCPHDTRHSPFTLQLSFLIFFNFSICQTISKLLNFSFFEIIELWNFQRFNNLTDFWISEFLKHWIFEFLKHWIFETLNFWFFVNIELG